MQEVLTKKALIEMITNSLHTKSPDTLVDMYRQLNPDVSCFKVTDMDTGSKVGIFFGEPKKVVEVRETHVDRHRIDTLVGKAVFGLEFRKVDGSRRYINATFSAYVYDGARMMFWDDDEGQLKSAIVDNIEKIYFKEHWYEVV